MQDFRDLNVWRKAHQAALDVYKATSGYPREEAYGLTSQIRRASVSIPTNIAEGCGTSSHVAFGRYLQIAMSSASEVEYLLLLSYDPRFLKKPDYDRLAAQVVEIKMMLASLLKRLHESSR